MLYHYTSPKVIMDIIREEGVILRFSRYDCLNDTSEGKEAVTIQQEVCEALKAEYEGNSVKLGLLEKIAAQRPDFKSIYVENCDPKDPAHQTDSGNACVTLHSVSAVPYICSFSRARDALTMWNYYTKGTHYEGYNVGLDVEDLSPEVYDPSADERCSCVRGPKPGLKCEWWSVIYDKDLQREKIRPEVERILRTGEFSEAEYAAQLNNWAIRFKNEIFRHEKEERLICYVPEESAGETDLDDYIRFRVVNGCLVPYLDVLISDKSALREITIGPLIEDKLAVNTMELFLRLKGYPGVKIYTSEAPIRY